MSSTEDTVTKKKRRRSPPRLTSHRKGFRKKRAFDNGSLSVPIPASPTRPNAMSTSTGARPSVAALPSPSIAPSSPRKDLFSCNHNDTVDRIKGSIRSLLEIALPDWNEQAKLISELSWEYVEQPLKNVGNCEDASLSDGDIQSVAANNIVTPGARKCPPLCLSSEALIPYDPQAFKTDNIKDASGNRTKNRRIHGLASAIDKIGNVKQQLLVLRDYLQRDETSPLAQALQLSVQFDTQGVDIVGNIKAILTLASKRNSNNQVKDLNSFQRTLMVAIVPNEMPPSSAIRSLARRLDLNCDRLHQWVRVAVASRQAIFAGNNKDGPPFVQTYARKHTTKYTKELIGRLHNWLFTKCEIVVASPRYNDTKMCIDATTGEKRKQQKYFYTTSVREILLQMALPIADGGFDGPRDNDGTLLMSDTMLRAIMPTNLSRMTNSHIDLCGCELCFMPTNLSRMTNSHIDLCGCELCFIPKRMIESLYSWAPRYLKKLSSDNQNGDNDESVNYSATAEEIEEVAAFFYFDYDKDRKQHRFEHPRKVVSSMTCCPVRGCGLYRFGCCLGHCPDCPTLYIPPKLRDKSNTAPRISFSTYEYHSFCKIHKSLAGAPTTCPHCNSSKNMNQKKHLTQRYEKIGDFFDKFFITSIVNYRRHMQHVILLGKNHCVQQRHERFQELPGSIDILRDFADCLKCKFHGQFQSTHFGENATVSMEGVAVRFQDAASGELQYHYHCFLADDNKEDAKVTYVNTAELIKYVRGIGLLKNNRSWLFEQSDGCSKQYRSGTSLKLDAVKACKYGIIINRMVSAPHHGKGDCDSQGGIDKCFLKNKMRDPATLEKDSDKKMDASTVDAKGKRRSFAKVCTAELSSPDRIGGMKSHGNKRKKREDHSRIDHRQYYYMDHGNTDHELNSTLPIANTSFKAKGFPTKKKEKNNGMVAHYHYYFDPDLGPNKCAARRIACACKPCMHRLLKPWVKGVDAKAQPKFQSVPNCEYADVMDGFNEWKILQLVPSSTDEINKEEVDDLYEDILSEKEAMIANGIRIGDFAAYEYDADDDYYIVRWTSEPFPYNATEHGAVEGAKNVADGTSVCRGVYWTRAGRAKKWYVPPDSNVEYLLRVRYVVETGITMLAASNANPFPTQLVCKRDKQAVLDMGPKRIDDIAHDQIICEMAKRACIDFEESNDLVVGNTNNNDTDDDGNDTDDE